MSEIVPQSVLLGVRKFSSCILRTCHPGVKSHQLLSGWLVPSFHWTLPSFLEPPPIPTLTSYLMALKHGVGLVIPCSPSVF